MYYVYPKSAEHYLIQHGTEMSVAPAKKPGVPKQCFTNSFREVSRDPGRLCYVEGVAYIPIPIIHAWVVDRETGLAYEATLKKNADIRYVGVPLKWEFVLRMSSETGVYGIFCEHLFVRKLVDGSVLMDDITDRTVRLALNPAGPHP